MLTDMRKTVKEYQSKTGLHIKITQPVMNEKDRVLEDTRIVKNMKKTLEAACHKNLC